MWLCRHGAVRTRQGWIIPPFTDLHPFVHMIKGTNVVTSDSLFETSDTIEHDARRIASAHMQCGTDNMTRSGLLPGMPHHVSCSRTVRESAEKLSKLHNYAHTLLAASHACDASLHTHMTKANIEPETKLSCHDAHPQHVLTTATSLQPNQNYCRPIPRAVSRAPVHLPGLRLICLSTNLIDRSVRQNG